MKKKEIIRQIINSYFQNDLFEYIERKKIFNFLNTRKIYTVVGPRRAGKTFYLFQIIDNLLKSGISKKQTLYFFLERDDLYPLEITDLNLILETYFEIVSFDKNKKYYIFLDEIQNIENWEKFALKIYNQFPNIELILTGSSSKLLSKEIYTGLRGKSFSFEILPLTLQEAFKFSRFDIKNLTIEDNFEFKKLFNLFLNFGLFPEVVLEKSEFNKKKLLDEYFDLIFYTDVIERYGFRNIKKLKTFRKMLVSYMTNFVNFSNLSKKVGVSENVVLNWFEAFKNSYLVFELKNFDFSIGKQEKSRSKIYLIDNGFYNLNFGAFKQDSGLLFENLVFLELKKRGFEENKSLFYFKQGNFDIDFVLFDDDIKFIQVVYELNEDNFEREVKQLLKIKNNFDKEVYLIFYENFYKKKLPAEINFIDAFSLLNEKIF